MVENVRKIRPIKAQPFGDYGPHPRLHPVYAALVFIVAVFVMVVGQGLGVAVLAFAQGMADSLRSAEAGGFEGPMDPIGLLYMLIVLFGLGAILSLLWVRFVENRPLASMGIRGEAALTRFVRGLGVGLAFNAIAVLAIFALGGYNVVAIMPAFSSSATLIMIALLLVGFIVQGSTEEILMRGWVMSAMAARFGLVIAVVVNSTVFAALHLGNEGLGHINWIAMANIVLVGLFLSFYALREGSLLGVCGFHAAWNWLLGLGFGLEVSGQDIDVPALIVDFDRKTDVVDWLTGGTFGPEGSITVSVVLIIGCLWFLLPKKG